MAMAFHQTQFLPYPKGAPNIGSLSNSRSQSHVLVTTDRAVAVLQYGKNHEYALQELVLEELSEDNCEVMTSGVIEYPGKEAVAVAYAQDEKLFLLVVPAKDALQSSFSEPVATRSNGGNSSAKRSVSAATSASNTGTRSSSSLRFELVAAPAKIVSVKALSLNSAAEVFHGVILFRDESMVAFGYIHANTSNSSESNEEVQCVRLSNEQFANFFPEFASFTHPVLAVDMQMAAGSTSWVAFGCADGFTRVFSGQVQDNCSCGPYEMRDFQLDGPVTSISLFPTSAMPTESVDTRQPQCNVLATCAVGYAVVFEDLFSKCEASSSQMLAGSDHFESIFAGVAADIDFDGNVELLVGTDDQVVLAYKKQHQVAKVPSLALPNEAAQRQDSTDERLPNLITAIGNEELLDAALAPATNNAPIAAPQDSASATTTESDVVLPVWTPLASRQWRFEAFGPIYSLAWLDVNGDGVPELLVASATGVYVLEADAALVMRKLDALLSAMGSLALI